MYIDATQVNDEIHCWARHDSGKLIKIVEPAPYYCYITDPNGKYKNMFNDSVSKKTFNSKKNYYNFVNNHSSSSLWESDISPIYKFLSEYFYKAKSTKPNVGFFDIEVMYKKEKGFPSYENPYAPVNSISLYDALNNKYHLFALTNDKSITINDEVDGIEVLLYHCVTERQLLDMFFITIDHIDVLSAWHGEGFDIPYLVRRAKKVYGIKGPRKLCRDGFRIKEFNKTDDYGNIVTRIQLTGRVHLDLLELYKRYTFGERENYRLDTIAALEVGSKKIEFDGTLEDLYNNDPKKFFEYNLHDVRLLKKIDDKMKLIDLAVGMSRQATIRMTDIFGSIKFLEHSIMNYCHFDRDEFIVLPSKNPNNKRDSFPGGLVLETKAGVYGWTQSIDLASLYPSIIRSINISPETHLYQCENGNKDFIKIVEKSDEKIILKSVLNKERIELTGKEIRKFIKESRFSISANGSIFKNEEGIIPEVLGVWYKERSRTKKLSKKLAKKGDNEESKFYDMRQNILKSGSNSLYGAISNPYSRFYSLDLAASVTLTGQEIEKYQTYRADTIIRRCV